MRSHLRARRRPSLRAVTIGSVIVAAAVAPAGGALASGVGSGEPSPALGQAQVVAQAILPFDAGEYHWAVIHRTVDPLTDVTETPQFPSFFVATAGVVDTLGDGGVPIVHLPDGEAAFVAAATRTTLHAAEAQPAEYFAIEIVDSSSAVDSATVGDPFTPGEGFHDVDLVGSVLAAGAEVTIAASPSAPIAVVVTDGELTVTPAGGTTETLRAGDARSLHDAITITNPSSESAALVAVIIGSPLTFDPSDGDATSTSTGSTSTTIAPTSTVVGVTTTAPTTTAPTTTAPTTTTEPDTDGDGLTDADEAGIGTNPNKADTDNDGFDDGYEFDELGTDPLNYDTDADGIWDAIEVYDHGTSPRDSDSDDDGLADGDEINNQCNPHVPDTDGDGLTDAGEFAIGTHCDTVDTDYDGVNDGTELGNGTDPTNPASF